MGSKSPVKSRTLWFNVLSIGAIAVAELQASVELKEALGANALWLMIAGAVVNMVIRFYTVEPIIKQTNPPPDMNAIDKALREEAEKDGMV